MHRPRIFISTVTRELAGTRRRIAAILLRKGYEPESQDIFGAEPGDLREMLRRKRDADLAEPEELKKRLSSPKPTPSLPATASACAAGSPRCSAPPICRPAKATSPPPAAPTAQASH